MSLVRLERPKQPPNTVQTQPDAYFMKRTGHALPLGYLYNADLPDITHKIWGANRIEGEQPGWNLVLYTKLSNLSYGWYGDYVLGVSGKQEARDLFNNIDVNNIRDSALYEKLREKMEEAWDRLPTHVGHYITTPQTKSPGHGHFGFQVFKNNVDEDGEHHMWDELHVVGQVVHDGDRWYSVIGKLGNVPVRLWEKTSLGLARQYAKELERKKVCIGEMTYALTKLYARLPQIEN
jgi:hypothetical protein